MDDEEAQVSVRMEDPELAKEKLSKEERKSFTKLGLKNLLEGNKQEHPAGSKIIHFGREGNISFKYADNSVVTARYNIFTFIPMFLFESFQKFGNAYFLVVSILQTVPSISITDGVPLSLIPLSVVLGFEARITSLEDRQRHRDDNLANSSKCSIIHKDGKTEVKQWRDILVGDIIKIRNREAVPCDCLLLAASDDPPLGVCYVETKSLDGETNLKIKQAPIETVEIIKNLTDSIMKENKELSFEEAMAHATCKLGGTVLCETPNSHLDTFTGSLTEFGVRDENAAIHTEQAIPLNLKNILLRGVTVRSTDFVYALVINTGHETKIMKSMVQTSAKLSILDRTINKMLAGFSIIIVSMCLFGAGMALDWSQIQSWDDKYIPGAFGADQFFTRAGTFFLLIASMIPISIYVSMKIIRVIFAMYVWWDDEMVYQQIDPLTGEKIPTRSRVRTMDLCDTIGQITHIFSDKTGTLTNNVMEFRKMSIAGKSYGQGTTVIGIAALERENKTKEAQEAKKFLESVEAAVHPNYINFVEDGFGEKLVKGEIPRAKEFLTALALCHEVLVETVRDDDGKDTGEKRLSANSPDDQALVIAATEMGVKFLNRGKGGRTITVEECAPSQYIMNREQYESSSQSDREQREKQRNGRQIEYELLETLEFTSTRKRASVIVKNGGQIFLYCKGADSEIFKRLHQSEQGSTLAHATNQHLTNFANDGLRTLTVAYKELNVSEFQEWQLQYKRAIADVNEQEKRKNKEENIIDKLMDKIEDGLYLLGATAIEDKLQEAVPETIKDLARAGIKLWVLTGDKEETAINIAWACQLIDHTMENVIINSGNAQNQLQLIAKLRHEKHRMDDNPDQLFALVIDGTALKFALEDHSRTKEEILECEKLLVAIAVRCQAVVCCRVSPKQKALIVTLVRTHLKKERTLAIGDGANDVGMIQSAHVGVGISGLEGLQAVNSADFALGRFKFLKRLLLLHGRNNYRRTTKLILLILYKTIFMIIAQVIWSHANGFSGQKFYFQLGVEGYNLIFTNSVLFISPFDKDLPDRYVLQFPQLYELGRKSQLLNYTVFWGYILNAWYHGILSYVLVYFAYGAPFEQDIWLMGTLLFTFVCVGANIKIALETASWNIISKVFFILIVASWPIAAFIFQADWFITVRMGWEFNNVFTALLSDPQTWAIWGILIPAVYIRDFSWKTIKREFFPELRHILAEHAKLSKLPWTYKGPVLGNDGKLLVISEKLVTSHGKKRIEPNKDQYVQVEVKGEV